MELVKDDIMYYIMILSDQLKMCGVWTSLSLTSPRWRHDDDIRRFQLDRYIGYITQLRGIIQFEFIKEAQSHKNSEA